MNIRINNANLLYINNTLTNNTNNKEYITRENFSVSNNSKKHSNYSPTLPVTEYSTIVSDTTSVLYGANNNIITLASTGTNTSISTGIKHPDAIEGTANVSTTLSRVLQTCLKNLGFYSGSIDGNINSSSFGVAYKNFERVYNGNVTGKFSKSIADKIRSASTAYVNCLNSAGLNDLVKKYTLDSSQKKNVALTWIFLKHGMELSSAQAAGVMGNIYAESAFSNDNAQNSKYPGVHDTSYSYKTRDEIGYGLIQWTYSSRKQRLSDKASEMDSTVSNINVQFACFRYEVTECEFKNAWSNLKKATTYIQASDIFLSEIEKPKTLNYSTRQEYSTNFYSALYRL